MTQPSKPQRWFSAWRSSEPARYDDPADLGTAFGLDLSMEDSVAEAPAGEPQAQPGWAQRLGLRRKSAT